MTSRIAIVTTVEMPVPDADEELLLPLMPEAELVSWDDPSVDWSRYDLTLLRSTWNYTEHLEEFLAWAERVSQVSRLMNPVETIRWNTDKRYLEDLAAQGFATVPTVFVAPGQAADPQAFDGHIVVKPSVGAGSSGAKMFRDDPAGASAHLAVLHEDGRTAMIQPYLSAVDTAGETALIYVGGEFSHAARKAAILSQGMSWSTGLYADEKVVATEATEAERVLADRIVASLPDLAYTRVDLLPTDKGPVVLELELTEPSLFLALGEGAPERAAKAFRALA
ncbi:ATP-grasp domain-containing protein [Demequina sp. SO4-18]|uniref:ATP-grasp domain-containing protein n=1 Tax=Demequina sp. SO4-18 TaxID=3401026 RepID=UPI003B5B08FE